MNMSKLDEEIGDLMRQGQLADHAKNEVLKETVFKALPRRPFFDAEMEMAAGFLKTWRLKGHRVFFGPAETLEPEERMKAVKEMAEEGVMVFIGLDHQCELMILKVDDGRGFFGRQKYRYHSYVSSPGDPSCLPNGSSTNLGWSISKLGNVLRS